jgi:hypothetical protein
VLTDDELEEVDVVSVASCNYEIRSRYSSATSVSSDQSQSNVRRQMLVLPASESMSAQVAAMHNYSSTRCRPTPASSVSANATTHSLITKRYFLLETLPTINKICSVDITKDANQPYETAHVLRAI